MEYYGIKGAVVVLGELQIGVSKEIGQLLKDRRKALNLTRQDVASAVGMTDGYISRIERGAADMTNPTFYAICAALKYPTGTTIDSHGNLHVPKNDTPTENSAKVE